MALQSGDVGGRFRRGLGARRPARAHAGRDLHHRQLPRHPPRRVRRRAAGERFHRQGAARRPAVRPGHLLPHPLCRTFRRRRSSASRWSAASAPRRATGARSPSSGRATPPARAGASTRRAAACAPTRPCSATGRISSSIPATPSMPTARCVAERKLPNGETLEEHRHRGEVQSAPRRSPSFAATTNTTCSTRTCSRSTPRSRCSRNGTTTRSPTTGGRASR